MGFVQAEFFRDERALKRLCTGSAVVDWVAKRTNEFGNFGAATGIGLQLRGEPGVNREFGHQWSIIAGVAYAEWNGVNVVCHIAAEGKRWATREFLGVIFDYPFRQLKAKRITVCVGSGNLPSCRFVKHLGFTLEATLKEAHPTGDLLIFSLREPQCRWLTLKRISHDEKLAA